MEDEEATTTIEVEEVSTTKEDKDTTEEGVTEEAARVWAREVSEEVTIMAEVLAVAVVVEVEVTTEVGEVMVDRMEEDMVAREAMVVKGDLEMEEVMKQGKEDVEAWEEVNEWEVKEGVDMLLP